MSIDTTDKTTNANTLINSGATGYTTDLFFSGSRGAVELVRASSQHLYVADTVAHSITGDITIEFCMKSDILASTAGANLSIVGKWDDNSQRSYLAYLNPSNDRLYFIYSSDGGIVNITQASTDAAVAVNEWHRWSIKADVSVPSVTFLKDGAVVASTMLNTSATAIYNSTAKFGVGASFNSGTAQQFFDGKLDDIRLFNDLRSDVEIAASDDIELSSAIIAEVNTVGYWPIGVYNGSLLFNLI